MNVSAQVKKKVVDRFDETKRRTLQSALPSLNFDNHFNDDKLKVELKGSTEKFGFATKDEIIEA